jgi:AcrR family transcriptional regulator
MVKNKPSTKQRILEAAVELFSVNGFTETSVRDLASAVGVNEASIYNHYPSKNAILENILEEYTLVTQHPIDRGSLDLIIKEPTTENILKCMTLVFPEEKREYYLKMLSVILQEHFRNPLIRDFVREKLFLSTESISRAILSELAASGALEKGTDVETWVRVHSSIIYSFACRHLLGIGDSFPGFEHPGMADLLRTVYGILLERRDMAAP